MSRVESLYSEADGGELPCGFFCLGHIPPAEFYEGMIRHLVDDLGFFDGEEETRAEMLEGLDRDDIEAQVAHRWMQERPCEDPDETSYEFHRREAPGLVLATHLDLDDLYRAPKASDTPLETFEVTMLGEKPLEEAA